MIRSPKHLAFIRTLPCITTGQTHTIEAAHIRSGTGGGMGLKPSDSFVVPLFYLEHRRQHQIGEKAYFGPKLDRTIWLSRLLWDNTGNFNKCKKIIENYRIGIDGNN